ncbi:hypothetical protein HQ35_09390 [Porphyromonas cangingivalis]|uniref:Uncharacterized protein n=1 Tax=Porphyromonas cangingivalis TaxID=36874 RepID=A0A0A2EQE3_PORCN|nr:hypothetical protein [Porphyromonas cangingivalis]KGN78594.1 hypothetical protein HQ35_09390 [Porphyromonas cangingivalis]
MKKYMSKYLLLLLFALSYVTAFAQADTKDADEAYANAEYAKAISLYQEAITNAPEPTSELYYNLGCAFFKDNQIAPAVLAFERAYLIDPSDSDIKYNIELANSRTLDKIDVAPTFFFSRWMDSLSHWFMLNTWLTMGIVLFTLAVVCFLFFLFGRERLVRMISFYAFIVFLFLCGVSNAMAYKSYHFSHDDTGAIVMSEIVTVKSAPDMSSQDLVIIHAGLKVEVLQKVNGFVEVSLPDKTVGWISATDIEVINVFTNL